MATTYTDDFQRVSLGTDWKVVISNCAIIAGSDVGLISGIFGLIERNDVLPADQFCKAIVSEGLGTDVFARGVFVRRRGSDGARYQLHYDFNGSDVDPTPVWQIKYDGVPTAQVRILAESPTPGKANAGDEIGIEVRGSEIKGYLNEQLILTANDTTIANGKTGLAFTTAGIPITQPQPAFASWAGGELAALPPLDSLPLTILSQTAAMITLGWTPQGDAGYLFLKDGVAVSNTNDPTRNSVTFKKQLGAKFEVRARNIIAFGSVVSP